MRSVPFLFFALAMGLTCIIHAHTIKHIIVVMEENRSFDHLLGWRPGVDGLKKTDCNEIKVGDPTKGKFCATKNASNIQKCDPDHSLGPTTLKIFGPLAVAAGNLTDPTMIGFVDFENSRGETKEKNHYCEVMEMFTVDHLPVMNAMADHFLLFDKFFASVPGPTWPNRLFVLSGTSGGLTETSNPWFQGVTGQLYPLRTIYDQVKDAGLTWKNYVNDTPWELFLESVAHHPENVVLMDEFYKDAREGTLPNFAFVNPRAGINFTYGFGSNDQHPDHDVALGEAFYKDIYEALRASPSWNDTLLILTYDEHGGFYDHVPTELNIPPPDDYPSWPDDFKFDRGGIRIPTLLLSPWIPKGVVEGRPPSQAKPQTNSQYELTSIMATVRKILNISEGPLTNRDAWAATFDHLLSEPTPRTDCPMHLPDPMPPTIKYLETEAKLPLNGLQTHIAEVHGHLSGEPLPSHVDKQGQISEWLQSKFQSHKHKVSTWKQHRVSTVQDSDYVIRCEPYIGMRPKFIGSNWSIPKDPSLPYRSIHLKIKNPDNASAVPIEYCMQAMDKDTSVGISRCYDTDPLKNKDRRQLWVITPDATLRPVTNTSLCATNYCTTESPSTTLSTKVTLEPCTGALNQRYGYQGPAAGNMGWYDGGMLSQGDAIYALVAVHKEF
jgi:phospholipase C